MTTLQAIGLTFVAGTTLGIVSLAGFGLAVLSQSDNIAPRCTSRHPNTIYNPDCDESSSQYRGNPWFGWIPWVLSLSYEDMLKGIPGTGTRRMGHEGLFLRVNLDEIVLLKFHALGLRISLLAMTLFLFFLAPIYYTARCYEISGDDSIDERCKVNVHYNLTEYERLTISNVPSLERETATLETADEDTIWGRDQLSISARLYTVVFLSWIVYLYTCYELQQEWIEVLAMRRVYFLEYDHWGGRRSELSKTYSDQHKVDVDQREPWIPHPEQRDTIPNISLYSVLVGGLPSLPSEVVGDGEVEEAVKFSAKQNIDWQLDVTASFFDHCVPNQPGFSSSVAAVTILPGANEIAEAWGKWYAAASKLRRLRFIRRQISERRHYVIDEANSHNQDPTEKNWERDWEVPETNDTYYANALRMKEYNRLVLGEATNEHVEDKYLEALDFGPEQTAIYSREFAQSAAPCCPNGCFEGSIRRAALDDLLELEKAAVEDVHQANIDLREAQKNAAIKRQQSINDGGSKKSPNTSEHKRGHKRTDTVNSTDYLPKDLETEVMFYERGQNRLKNLDTSYQSGDGMDTAARHSRFRKADNDARTNGKPTLARKIGKSTSTGTKGSDLLTQGTSSGWQSIDSFPPVETASLQDAHVENDSDGEGILLPKDFVPDKGIWFHAERKNIATWDLVDIFVQDAKHNKDRSYKISTGQWAIPPIQKVTTMGWEKIEKIWRWTFSKSKSLVVDTLARESTYAVVTFTSRQAALAARHCLADGRGYERWIAHPTIPIPPLADAAPYNIFFCRGCCRPVSINIDNRQKTVRNMLATAVLVCLFFFYSLPITVISTTLISPERIDRLIPALKDWESDSLARLSGLLVACLYALFFSVCPVVFKMIANFGSNATSVASADFKALQYYWWFMIVTAFASSSLLNMALQGINEGISFEDGLEGILVTMADSIPTTQSATWINWIILRFTVVLPYQYLLQINTFAFDWLGWKCCARLVRGGGPGGATPYRIYVDSGVVLLCVFALGPPTPLVTPCAVLYFLVTTPLLRRNIIFMYRPKYDLGGGRWPFLFDICVSAMVLSQIILTTMMILRGALGPGIVAGISIIPTVYFRLNTRRKFLQGFRDASLLQTSLVDGWDTCDKETATKDGREEFRRFLVDAHKAAYVPVCIAGGGESIITAEPAVVVPADHDIDEYYYDDGDLKNDINNINTGKIKSVEECSSHNSVSGDTNQIELEIGGSLGGSQRTENSHSNSRLHSHLHSHSNTDATLRHSASHFENSLSLSDPHASLRQSAPQFGATMRRISTSHITGPQMVNGSQVPRKRTSSFDFLSFHEDGSVSFQSPRATRPSFRGGQQSLSSRNLQVSPLKDHNVKTCKVQSVQKKE